MKKTWPTCNVKTIARALAISMAATLAACGGGGGSSGTAADNNTAAPGGSATTPLVLTDKNGVSAAYVATSYGELTVALAELTTQWIDAVQGTGTLARSRTCSNGGTETLTIDDLDRSGTITPGDVLRVQLQRCYSRWVDAPISGGVQFQWTERTDATHQAGLATFRNDFSLTDADVTLGISGTLVVRRAVADAVTTLDVASYGTAPLAIQWQGNSPLTASAPREERRSILAAARPLASSSYRDTVERIDVSKRIDVSQPGITTRLQLQLSSELLGGQLTLATTTPLQAEPNTYPHAGEVWITGANNARLTLLAVYGYIGDGTLPLRLDVQGDGQADYTRPLAWNDLSLGVLGATEDLAADEAAMTRFTTNYPSLGTFRLLSGARTQVAHNDAVGPLRWQFSAPFELESRTQLALWNITQNGRANPWTLDDWSVPVTVTHRGAYIELTPTRPLVPGSTYQLVDIATGGAPRLVISGSGTWQWDYTLSAADVIQAKVQADAPGVVSAGLNASLHASHAYAGTSILSLQWRQVSGPPVVLSSTTAAHITVGTPPTGGSNGQAVLELRAQTTEGDVDYVRIQMPVIGDPLHATQVLFSAAAGVDTSQPGITFLANHLANFMPTARVYHETVNGTVLQMTLYTSDERVAALYRSRVLMFGTPTSTLVPGTYATTGTPTPLSVLATGSVELGACSPETGTAQIHEIQTGPDNEITRLALDYEINSCAGVAARSGSIRINSDRGLRWP